MSNKAGRKKRTLSISGLRRRILFDRCIIILLLGILLFGSCRNSSRGKEAENEAAMEQNVEGLDITEPETFTEDSAQEEVQTVAEVPAAAAGPSETFVGYAGVATGRAKEAERSPEKETTEEETLPRDTKIETPTVKATDQKVKMKKTEDCPDIDITSWEYVLANKDNGLGDYEPPKLAEVGSAEVDARIADALTKFVDDAVDKGGVKIYLSTAFQSYDTQKSQFNNRLKKEKSREKVEATMPVPGYSDHQTGLSIDITDVYRKNKTEKLASTATIRWLTAHCHEYGFILRFPKDKTEITRSPYEPWHFRYVGKEAATYIMKKGLCLEEFWELYQ